MVRKRRSPFGFGFDDDFFGSDIFDEMEKMMRGMREITPEGQEIIRMGIQRQDGP
jgi:hypothetical protein